MATNYVPSHPRRDAIMWRPFGKGQGGLTWELRFLLLSYLSALATDRTLMLGAPSHVACEVLYSCVPTAD